MYNNLKADVKTCSQLENRKQSIDETESIHNKR